MNTTVAKVKSDTGGAAAATVGALCITGSVAVGIMLTIAIGAASMVEAGGDQRLGQHAQLLTIAEALKFGNAIAAAWVVAAVDAYFKSRRGKPSGIAMAIGLLSAALLAASAVAGLAPLHLGIGRPDQMTFLAHGLGLASVAANGIWALWVSLSAWGDRTLPRWLCIVGILLCAVSLVTALVPPVGLLVAVLGIVWLLGLATCFLRKP